MNVTVYCSARNQIPDELKQLGYALGEWIACQGHTLVYGGATGGLMTSVAEGVHAHNGKLIGVIPNRILKANRLSPLLTEQYEVGTMCERKQKMKDLADCVVVLPGGYGTLDELFDVLASGMVGEHKKPLFIVNYDGVYDSLLTEIHHMTKIGLIPIEQSYSYSVVQDLPELIEGLNQISAKL